MDQQALLAQLLQMNSNMTNRQGLVPLHAGGQLRQGLSTNGLASAPCFSMPGLTLQGFHGVPTHNQKQQSSSMIANSNAIQTLLNASQAASNSAAQREYAAVRHAEASSASTALAAHRSDRIWLSAEAAARIDSGNSVQKEFNCVEAPSVANWGLTLSDTKKRCNSNGASNGKGPSACESNSSTTSANNSSSGTSSGKNSHSKNASSTVRSQGDAAPPSPAASSSPAATADGKSGSEEDNTTEADDDREKLMQLASEHKKLKRRLVESEAELERLREVVNTLLEKKKKEDKVEGVSGSSESDKEAPRRYWLQEEHDRFLEALQMHGPKAMKAISDHVATRTPVQVRTHAQKYFQRLARISASESINCSGRRRGGAEGGASSGDVTDSRGASANSDFCSERGSERGE